MNACPARCRNACIMIACALFVAGTLPGRAGLKLPGVFQDNMVLQRDMPVPVWGRTDPGAKVTVSFSGQTRTATADTNGNWSLKLDPLSAGGPFQLTVAAGREVVFTNVLVGDVWLCSGQSNMARSLRGARNAEAEIAAANYPLIRLLPSPVRNVPEPAGNLQYEGRPWQVCAPETAGGFTAVGYFFGRALHKDLNIPIGLIQASLGGTPIQLWIARDYMEKSPVAKKSLDAYDAALADPELPKKLELFRENEKKMINYFQSVPKSEKGPWAGPELDDASWVTIDTAKPSAEGSSCALLELRRTVDIPDAWSGKELMVSLYFTRADGIAAAVFLNGAPASRQAAPPDRNWVKFAVPGEKVRPGKALLAARVFARWYHSLWQSDFGQSEITAEGGDGKISLAGQWRAREADRFAEPVEPMHAGNRRRAPCGHFNGMINPLMPFAIKGAVWYQGEANAGDGYGYRELMPLMIKCWRDKWGQGDFPFMITQLPNFRQPSALPGESAWAELREAQALTAQNTPNCGVAVTIELGEAEDIHPKNKQDVGARLALVARKVAYGQDIVFTGPTYKSMRVEGGKIHLAFDNVGGGLVAKGNGPLKMFAVAGADKRFAWANAEIRGNEVVVWNDAVKEPVAARYAWADNPEGCNLYNKEGLPAMPFRTDDWRQ
ncbi:MAG: sialate O-acetylesterase [Kiritimatiellia bacterium]